MSCSGLVFGVEESPPDFPEAGSPPAAAAIWEAAKASAAAAIEVGDRFLKAAVERLQKNKINGKHEVLNK